MQHLQNSYSVSIESVYENTVNFEIFARVLFLRSFADAKFCEHKTPEKWQNHSVITNGAKPCPSRILNVANMALTLLAKIKFSQKILNLQ